MSFSRSSGNLRSVPISLPDTVQRAKQANEFKRWNEALKLYLQAETFIQNDPSMLLVEPASPSSTISTAENKDVRQGSPARSQEEHGLEDEIRSYGGHIFYRLGSIYKHGHGVPKDIEKANDYFQKALSLVTEKAKDGNKIAQCDLAIMYECGDGVEQNYELALYWYQLAAEQGLEEALCNIGYMYSNGTGIPKDTALAVEYYTKAAEKGYPRALYNLGYMYSHQHPPGADGVPIVKEDKAKAVELYLEAARQGYCLAQHNLGFMYSNGFGTEKNKALAVKYYQLAACQGNAMSIYNLGFLYQKGEGIPKNLKKSFKCFLQASLRDHSNSIKQVRKILNKEIPEFDGMPIQFLKEEWRDFPEVLGLETKLTILETYLVLKRHRMGDLGSIPIELIDSIVGCILEIWEVVTKQPHYNLLLLGGPNCHEFTVG